MTGVSRDIAGCLLEYPPQEWIATVVEASTAGDTFARLLDFLWGQSYPHTRVCRQRHTCARNAYASGDGPRYHPCHAIRPLDACHVMRIVCGRSHVRIQLSRCQKNDICFTQTRKNLIDVVKKDVAGSDDQHPVTCESFAMRVKQPCGSVKRDDGLASPGASLHDGDLVKIAANNCVLIGCNGGKNVCHPSRARRFHCRQTRVNGFVDSIEGFVIHVSNVRPLR